MDGKNTWKKNEQDINTNKLKKPYSIKEDFTIQKKYQ